MYHPGAGCTGFPDFRDLGNHEPMQSQTYCTRQTFIDSFR